MASSPADNNAAPSPPTTTTTKPYLHGYHASVLRSHSTRTAQNSCPHLLPHLRRGMRVLDVGCGPGTITTDLAAIIADTPSTSSSPSTTTTSPSPSNNETKNPTGHITALDASPAVLATARAHAAATGTKNITFRLGDACALPFADDAAFDAVHAHQVVQHVADPVAAVREMRRVVRRDGGVVALREGDGHVWFCPHLPPRPHRGERDEGGDEEEEENPGDVLAEWYELWLRMARDAGAEPMAGRRLLSYALRAGFAPDEVRAGVGSRSWAGREELREWCGMWADRVVLSEFADNAVRGGYATREGLERLARAWRAFAEVEGAWYGMMQGEAILTRRG